MKNNNNSKKMIVAILALIATLILLLLLYKIFMPDTVKGTKVITVTVIHGNKVTKEFTYRTDAEYLGDLLEAEHLVEGESGAYGLFITTVDGESANESKQQWWCLKQNGKMTTTSADQTPLEDGDSFELTMTEGY